MSTFFGNGTVWDKDRNKPLCRFVNQQFTTKDPYIKDRLNRLGYIADHDDEIVIIEDVEEIEMIEEVEQELTEEELREKAKELGIKSYWNKNIDKLKAEVGELIE